MGWVWAFGIIIVFCVLVYSSTATRNLADVEFADTQVTVTPRGLNKLWTFKRQVSIPISSIKSARVVSGTRDLPKGLRLPGTSIPGLILGGTYLKAGEKSFYAVRDGRDILLLELERHKYSRIGIQTRDPYAVVNRIASSLRPTQP